jgi:hypothetical protein
MSIEKVGKARVQLGCDTCKPHFDDPNGAEIRGYLEIQHKAAYPALKTK